ncbi:5234_t:CDS:2 [Paraglomus occultum]|uniref:5234_t:CDS:1 n=1 Tax=Paraglomus occultum TaxID=144539 RepID=A0A9N9A016_9GLOM|nr:5234_t:CDS:2 [Paraglomus occultum]
MHKKSIDRTTTYRAECEKRKKRRKSKYYALGPEDKSKTSQTEQIYNTQRLPLLLCPTFSSLTGTAKDDFELNQTPPSSPRLSPHITPSSLEAPSQLQVQSQTHSLLTSQSHILTVSPPPSQSSSRPSSPTPLETSPLISLPLRPSTPTHKHSSSHDSIITLFGRDNGGDKDGHASNGNGVIINGPNNMSNGNMNNSVAGNTTTPNAITTTATPQLSTRTHPSCSRCPPEVFLTIFELLCSIHQSSLFSCILVNREWNFIATSVLWSNPRFSHMRALDKFIGTLEAGLRVGSKERIENKSVKKDRKGISSGENIKRSGIGRTRRERKEVGLTEETTSRVSSQIDVSQVEGQLEEADKALQSHNSRLSNPYHHYQSYVRTLDLTHLTEHDRNSSTLSTHLLRLLPIIHDEGFTSLNLSFVKGITNAYLTKLLSPFLSHIKTLNLAGGSRSDSCISSVIPNCLSVQHLSLAWNTGISDSSIESVAEHVGSKLRSLDLTNCEKVSDRALIAVAKGCTRLRVLKVSYCRGISEEGISEVMKKCEELEILDVIGCLGINNEFVNTIRNWGIGRGVMVYTFSGSRRGN